MKSALPEPKLAGLSTASIVPQAANLASKPPQQPSTPPRIRASPSPSPSKPQSAAKNPMDFPEADPWGSPAMHKGHHHETAVPTPNGVSSNFLGNGSHEPVRTTSSITIASNGRSPNGNESVPPETATTPASGVWGSYNASSSAPFDPSNQSTIGVDGGFGAGFGEPDRSRPPPSATMRSIGGGRGPGVAVEENVVVTLLPEKEGMFMFQHHNYTVSSARRGSKVVRRYSDFVWLLDCLHKRYPFRQLPLLPPKRVGGLYPKIQAFDILLTLGSKWQSSCG